MSRFINKRYVGNLSYPKYFLHNGVLKRYISSPITKKLVNDNQVFYLLEDLPSELQTKLEHLSATPEELMKSNNKSKYNIIDKSGTIIYVNSKTELMPVVGNILPSDGIPAYTVILENDKPTLKPILVCWNLHWAELFAGQTPYGMNVFCLATDLSDEQRINYQSEIITLEDSVSFLGLSLKRSR